MIGRLRGRIDAVTADSVIIDVNGVGYVVHCGARCLARLPAAGEEASLAIETVVREDMIRLYGFESPEEREWFRLLQGVQGVGARVALAILSVLDGPALTAAVALQDAAALARANGVGPKLAKRIVSELKDKAPAESEYAAAPAAVWPETARRSEPAGRTEAISALVNLGYAQLEASAAVDRVLDGLGPEARVEALIRGGLRHLGQSADAPS
ncbi:MAG: Holliday junction branch migration protein RuvA [Alphaproteobacteria bacterium]